MSECYGCRGSSKKRDMNRREFLAAASAAAAVIALAGETPLHAESRMTRVRHMKRKGALADGAARRARERAEAMVAQMTLEEKISQTGSTAAAIPRLQIRAYQYWHEALHGLLRGAPVTAFPLPVALACTWNPEFVQQVYNAVSDEARGWNQKDGSGLMFFSPTMLNMARDPRWGRCDEGLGEDPCLVSTMGVAQVSGMQGNHPGYLKTGVCAKHYICNNTEDDRFSVSAPVDARSFWEYYSRPFHSCVTQGDVYTVMSAYSAINDVPCTANHFLLTELLRERWGFDGYVVSDCDAVACISQNHHYVPTLHEAAALGITAGCDLNCGGTYQQHLAKAVELELVSEEEIGRAVARVLTARVLLGEFDHPDSVPYSSIPFSVCNSDAHQKLALEAARQTITLLKNEKNMLPLETAGLKTVAVIGPTADFHLGGYSGSPSVRISPIQGIAQMLGLTVHRDHLWGDNIVNSSNVQTESSTEGGADIGFIENGSWVEFPAQNFTGKTSVMFRVSSAGAGGNVELHLDSLGHSPAAVVSVQNTGGWQNWTNLSANLQGIEGEHKIFVRFTGGEGYLLNLLWLQLLPHTKSAVLPDKPALLYEPGCSIQGAKDDALFQQAVDAAAKAEVALLFCGVNQSVDSEGHDRQDITLPGAQEELIQAVLQANPRTVLVLHTNNSLAIEQAHNTVPAIICSFFAGQAQGQAIAEVLFGRYNPGGKLPQTWYRSIDQLPHFHDYDVSKGRTYMYLAEKPLYPFGHGLSYTTFTISEMKTSSDTLSAHAPLQIEARVTNTGKMAGDEVVQLYVKPPASSVKRPIRELAGFQRVTLKPGESKTVRFTLPMSTRALWYWNEPLRRFSLQTGTLTLEAGSSSAEIQQQVTVNLADAPEEMGAADMLSSVAVASTVS